jgi:hypothetical protein
MRTPGIYPEMWKSGRCPIRHQLYTQCQRARAQARFRNQQWEITEEQYIQLWQQNDRYKQRGRGRHSLCMTRRDKRLPWRVDNVEFMTRQAHFSSIYEGVAKTDYVRETEC